MTPLESKLKELKELCDEMHKTTNPGIEWAYIDNLIRALEVAMNQRDNALVTLFKDSEDHGSFAISRSNKQIESILNQEGEGENNEAD